MISLIMMTNVKKICTEKHQPESQFLKGILAIPARRALEKEKINNLEQLSDYKEKEQLQFHGFGKNTIEKLRNFMQENNFTFKSEF